MTDSVPPREWPPIVATVSGGIVALVAVSILLGGVLESPPLLRWTVDLPPAAPVISVPLGLCALGVAARGPRLRLGASAAALAITLSLGASRFFDWGHPAEGWLVSRSLLGDAGDQLLPSATSIRCLIALSLAIAASRRFPRSAQVLTAVPLLIGAFTLLSYAYGERLSTIRESTVPDIWTSAPAALAFLAGALGVLALTAEHGLSAWLVGGSPGRRTFRGLLPILLVGQALIVWVARQIDITDRLGVGRGTAVVVMVLTGGTFLVALLAVRRVDQLASDAAQVQVIGSQLAAAQRGLRLATLAGSLARVSTADEVVHAVTERAAVTAGADRADLTLEPPREDAPAGHPARAEVFRTGQAVLIASAEEYAARYGPAAGGAESLGGAIAVLPVKHRLQTMLGVLTLAWYRPVELDETMTSVIRTVGEIVAQSLDRARMTDALALEARRSTELAHLAEALAGAVTRDDVTIDDVLRFLAERASIPAGALSAAIAIVDRDNQVLRRYFGGAFDSESAQRYSSVPVDSTMPMAASARTGEMFLFADLDQVASTRPEALEACLEFGYQAFATMPLRDHDGELFGSLMLGWDHPVHYDDSDRALLSTVADMAAQTLERTWLAEGRARDTERSALLAALARRMTVLTHTDEVAGAVTDHLPAVLGAITARLDLAGEGAHGLGEGVDPSPRFRVPRPPANRDGSSPYRSTDRPTMELPLVVDDEVMGVVHAEWDRPIDVDGPLRSTVATVGDLLTVTLQRVRLAEARRQVIDDLQRRALLLAPPMEGLRVAARYQPARIELGMGGDWYQALPLEGDRLGLVVGDVVGHGAAAAGDMTQLSGILAALLRVGTSLEELFVVAQEAVGSLEIMASAVVCVIDPGRRCVHHVSAGHPPLVLSDARGETELLTGGRTPIIGLPRSRATVAETPLPPGSTLLAYTDGLVERRGEHLDVGLARVRDVLAATVSLDVEAQVDEVLQRCTLGHRVEDDIAVVAVRVLP